MHPQLDNQFDSLKTNVGNVLSSLSQEHYCPAVSFLKARSSRKCLVGCLLLGVSDVTSLERVVDLRVCTLLLTQSLPLPNILVSLILIISIVEDCRLIC